MREAGIYQIIADLQYFIPHNLPPTSPPLEVSTETMYLYGEASVALGQLDEVGQRLPNPTSFIKAYTIKEALLSSAIEGIHTTLVEVFTGNLEDSKPNKDTQLVLNYMHALDAALNMMQKRGLPIVSSVLLKAHEVLMKVGEGDKASPGLFRKQPVRVGPLVPPPAPEVPNLMSNLEKYINEDISTAPLIKAGLAHVQFEIIHPFLDGNGRIGRLLIVLMLVESGLLKLPILYPSYYFKKHHLEYYQKLDRVRTHGDFEGWINYYLRAIKESAIDSYTRAKAIENLEAKFKQLIHTDTRFAKIRETSSAGLDHLFEQPVISTAAMSKKLGKAYNTAQNLLNVFMKCGLISENTVHKRSQTYRFDPYIELLEKDL